MAAPVMTTARHSRCLTPRLARLAATAAAAFFCAAAAGAGREQLPLFVRAEEGAPAAAARSGESDLARLGSAPSRRTFSSAAANGSKPLCFLPPVPPACCAATDDDEVGDHAAEAPTE